MTDQILGNQFTSGAAYCKHSFSSKNACFCGYYLVPFRDLERALPGIQYGCFLETTVKRMVSICEQMRIGIPGFFYLAEYSDNKAQSSCN